MARHIADAETTMVVMNVNPDFCDVDGKVVPYDISQTLDSEKAEYSPDSFARGQKVLRVGSVIRGVVGNAGAGVRSGVSEGAGDVVTMTGSEIFFVNGKGVCRHDDEVEMNVQT
jgi:hypothetical protein